MEKMKHLVKFDVGYDCIRFECKFKSKMCKPKSIESHGRHGIDIRFISKGKKGAVQFLLYTGWLPQNVEPTFFKWRNVHSFNQGIDVLPADLGYYSKTSHYTGQKSTEQAYEFCDGQPCFYAGSALNAYDAMYALVNGGDNALWTFLDAYYATVFHGAEYPAPTEYPMPLRKNNKKGK